MLMDYLSTLILLPKLWETTSKGSNEARNEEAFLLCLDQSFVCSVMGSSLPKLGLSEPALSVYD